MDYPLLDRIYALLKETPSRFSVMGLAQEIYGLDWKGHINEVKLAAATLEADDRITIHRWNLTFDSNKIGLLTRLSLKEKSE